VALAPLQDCVSDGKQCRVQVPVAASRSSPLLIDFVFAVPALVFDVIRRETLSQGLMGTEENLFRCVCVHSLTFLARIASKFPSFGRLQHFLLLCVADASIMWYRFPGLIRKFDNRDNGNCALFQLWSGFDPNTASTTVFLTQGIQILIDLSAGRSILTGSRCIFNHHVVSLNLRCEPSTRVAVPL
jgi:hypothetical protein